MYLEYQGVFRKLRLAYFRKVIRRFELRQGMRLLDYGCGPGDMLQIAIQCGLDAHGIDCSDYSIELARRRGLNVARGDCDTMEYEDGFFDVVFAQSVIEHVRDPVHLVQSLRRVIAPGGLLVLSSPTPGADFWDDPTHIRPHTPKSLADLAQMCDFEIVEICYVFAFLLGLRLKAPFFYKILNLLPLPTGSNLIGAFRKAGG